MNDPFVGKLVFFRIYSGSLKKEALYNARTGKTERISRLLVMKADARDDIDAAYPATSVPLSERVMSSPETLFNQGL